MRPIEISGVSFTTLEKAANFSVRASRSGLDAGWLIRASLSRVKKLASLQGRL